MLMALGCNPPDADNAPLPVMPAIPAAIPSDPSAMFAQWKETVSKPDKLGTSMAHVELALALHDKAPEYVGKMVDLLVDPATSPQTRQIIWISLEVAQTPEVIPRLLDLTKPEVDAAIRTEAVIMLKTVSDPAVSTRLHELTKDPERRVRMAAIMMLSEGGDKDMRAALQDYYFTEDLPVEHRDRIVQSLALNPDSSDIKVYGAAANDALLPEFSRRVAVGGLGRLAEPACLEPLQQCVNNGDTPPQLKEEAAYAVKLVQEKAASGSLPGAS